VAFFFDAQGDFIYSRRHAEAVDAIKHSEKEKGEE